MIDVAQLPGGWMERKFRFAERGTTLARDTMAGATTFIGFPGSAPASR